jgi:hypothetical protein
LLSDIDDLTEANASGQARWSILIRVAFVVSTGCSAGAGVAAVSTGATAAVAVVEERNDRAVQTAATPNTTQAPKTKSPNRCVRAFGGSAFWLTGCPHRGHATAAAETELPQAAHAIRSPMDASSLHRRPVFKRGGRLSVSLGRSPMREDVAHRNGMRYICIEVTE